MPATIDSTLQTKPSGQNYGFDIVIIGGGVAGLWTLARLRQQGYQAILLEADALGCVQSGASQGIIHGGTKYALTGKLTHSAQSIKAMPQRWQACLEGRGEIDLRQTKKLSQYQYLWSTQNLTSRLAGFFASKVMSSRMQRLAAANYVAPFNQPAFQGQLYQLDEPVLDIQSLIETIRSQYHELIFRAPVDSISERIGSDKPYRLSFAEPQLPDIDARVVVLTAGADNERLLGSLHLQAPKMQRRPLLMPMLKAPEKYLPRLYAHCLGASALPKMTISSHHLYAGSEKARQVVWYLGGDIAEKGVGLTIEQQVHNARAELQAVMPWMDFSHCQWSALAVDRAEPAMPDGSRPVQPGVFRTRGVITAWPVKLAMAPIMADKVVQEMAALHIPQKPQSVCCRAEQCAVPINAAQTSQLPWEKVDVWL